MSDHVIQALPPEVNLETNRVLKNLTKAHKALAELKGFSETIPNQNILINAVIINEAKDSSAIENIITTHDELYKTMSRENYLNPAAKEIINYRTALWRGYQLVKTKRMLTTDIILEIQQLLETNRAGIRKLPGTVLMDDATGEVVYTPPAGEQEIIPLLNNWEKYINEDNDSVDPLVKLAVLHYQFEVIHPFYDGNGRTGRIINVLYLVLKELIDAPILYLSKFLIRHKKSYYGLLREVTEHHNWEEWILFILQGVEETAKETLQLLKQLNDLLETTAQEIKGKLHKIYSRELLELLFFEFYTKIAHLEKGLNVSRKTAANYLSSLEEAGFLVSEKVGRERIYLNNRLFDIVKEGGRKNNNTI